MSVRVPLTLTAAALLALAASVPPAVQAAPNSPGDVTIEFPYADGRIIVGFVPGTPAAEQAAALEAVGAQRNEQLTPLAVNDRLVRLASGRSVGQALAALRHNPNVRYADPDYLVTTQATSNDPYVTNGTLWGMYGDASSPANQYGSQAAEAWAAGQTGSRDTYVVVIDEGIQITHPDLAANTWRNPFDPVDGSDNDGNGYIDDTYGWDFYFNDRTVYDGTGDDHATHVAGTIGGIGGNGGGVAGVNWNVTMISAKFLGPNGGYTSDAIKAVDYATDLKTRHGLDIVATSNSWGGGGFTQGLADAIARGGAQGILFIAAAGNSGGNNDVTPSYPSNYTCSGGGFDCVLAVAAIDRTGALASFSQYGATTVDLGAPGVSITSTLPVDTYGSYSGTSMATPHVSGAAALCASAGSKRGSSLKSALMSLTTPTASLAGKTVSGGRLDLTNLTGACGAATPPPSGPSITGMSPISGPVGTSVTISGTGLLGASVTFAGTGIASSVDAAGTSITFAVPAGASGSNAVSVLVGGTPIPAGTFTVTTRPGIPGIGIATAGSRSATVKWTPPSDSGGSPLTSYRITAYLLNGSVAKLVTGVSPSAVQYTMNGLKRGTSYYFKVQAANAVGISDPSSPSNTVKVG